MEPYLWLQYGHILAFVYWLGGDLGTYVASGQVVRRDLGVEARQTALKIMLVCDQGPKLAMPAAFVLGYQMAVSLGWLSAPSWFSWMVWILGLLWFANVIILHHWQGKPFAAKLAVFDFRFRLAVILLLVLAAGFGLAGTDYLAADRAAWKTLVFAALMACGVMIRHHLKPFAPAFAALVAEGPSEQRNAVLEQSLARCRPYVWAIWLGLLLNAAIGVRLL